MNSLDFAERESLRGDLPSFRVGDAVRVHVRVKEGDKERIQVFEGLVIRRRGGGAGETFTVRKIASGVGVERIFPVQSPLVTKVEVKSRGFVRRSRLYYLRDLSGKKARLKSKVRDLSALVAPDVEAPQEEPVAEAAVVEESVEAPVEEKADSSLRGKARKRNKAKDKAKRMEVLKAEELEKAKRREAEEAEQAAQAAREEEAAAEAPEGEADAQTAVEGEAKTE